MSFKTLRQGAAVAVLASVIGVLPASGDALGHSRPEMERQARTNLIQGWRTGFAGLWALLDDLFRHAVEKNRAGIDPNGTLPPGTSK